ncbi:HVO_0649 family zinc finger protein [Halalkalicoccus ordinarius]|uniref:HVO_0649 family zinc finger protein n=1 Tax=Halalkalicoccus ordinarius TaxID=3116651 RepID=UPI00300F3790
MSTSFERVRRRYETTEKKCPTCGYIDKEGNWTSETDGQQIVYHHTCPSCDTNREHTFTFTR